MSEVLEIQIQDRGSVGPSAGSSPPRAPSVGNVGPARQAITPASGPSGTAMQPVTGTGKAAGIAEQLASALGYGKQFQAIRGFFQSFAQKPAAPAAGQIAAKEGSCADALRGVLEDGFGRVNKSLDRIADRFIDFTEPAPAVQPNQSVTEAKVQQPAARQTHGPASKDLRHNPDLDEAFGKAPKPQAPRVPQTPPLPSAAAERPPAPPLATPRPAAAAGEAAEGAEAAEVGELAIGAEGAGAALASVAAVAAPVAVAFGAAYAAIKITEGAFKLAGQAADVAGQQLSMLARNNYVGMFTSALDLATKGLDKVPLVGGVLSSAMSAASQSVKSFASVVGAFNERASELAAFSPDIMMAQQRQAMQSLFLDMREAQQLGPDLAKMIDAQSGLDAALREALLPIKEAIIPIITDIMTQVRDHLPELGRVAAAIIDILNVLVKVLDGLTAGILHDAAGPIEKILEAVSESLKHIRRHTANLEKPDLQNDIYLTDLLKPLDWAAVNDPWRHVEKDPRPFIPAVHFAGL